MPHIFILEFILLSHPNSNSNSTLVGVTRKLVYSFFAPAPPLPTETSNSSWLIWCKGNLESGVASKVITTILKPSSFTLFLLSPSLSSRVSAWHSCQKLNLKKNILAYIAYDVQFCPQSKPNITVLCNSLPSSICTKEISMILCVNCSYSSNVLSHPKSNSYSTSIGVTQIPTFFRVLGLEVG